MEKKRIRVKTWHSETMGNLENGEEAEMLKTRADVNLTLLSRVIVQELLVGFECLVLLGF